MRRGLLVALLVGAAMFALGVATKAPCRADQWAQRDTQMWQARCYSEHYLGLHVREQAKTAGFPGASYASMGKEQTKLRADIATAQAAGNADAVKALNDKLTAAGNLRTTLQTTSMMRGQLLNAWGWDTFGIGIIVTGAAMIAIALVFGAALAYELSTKAVTVEATQRAAKGGALPVVAQ